MKINCLVDSHQLKGPLCATVAIKEIASKANTGYTLIYTKPNLRLGMFALERMLQIAQDTGAGMVYADHYRIVNGEKKNHPVVTYQKGSLRDDFDFGSVLLFKTQALKKAVSHMDTEYQYAGLYDLRLKVSQTSNLVHINEYLYTEIENDTRQSGEKIFDYVDPKNRDVQLEMEKACTNHLRTIGAYLAPGFQTVDFNEAVFKYEASVIIPVKNRARTIADAIQSVLNQKTNFTFNLIVVDNYSTDGTTEIIEGFHTDGRLIHIIPENRELGIGGCWNAAVHHPLCGKFAVQLDSDDVYSGEDTLQKIVDAFYAQNCAMVVGSYMLTDFNLNVIPPGIIDHREWTPDNGRNNALRINGLGAPRAFYTPVLREIKVPNTSYGEDYALGLRFSRQYRIGRIYDVLYLCRRWEDNSDASLDFIKMNAHNTYKDRIRTWELEARVAMNQTSAKARELLRSQLKVWELARTNYEALKNVKTKAFTFYGFTIKVQFNPARFLSSAAQVDAKSIRERKCFLCPCNLPKEQVGIPFGHNYQILVNPFPIFPEHFTIPVYQHTDQRILHRYGDMLDLAKSLDNYTIFYNGPASGASAPDHAHFQAGIKGFLPIEKEIHTIPKETVHTSSGVKAFVVPDYLRACFVMEAKHKESALAFFKLLYSVSEIKEGDEEPRMNILTWYENNRWYSCFFPREKHRPDRFFAKGDDNMLIGPASVDMGGVLVTPREKDFDKITKEDISRIMKELSLSAEKIQTMVDKIKRTAWNPG